MKSPATSSALPRVVSAIAAVVALTVALAGPAGYFQLGYERISAEMLTEIDIKAQDASQLISATAEMWVYQKYRLQELLRRRPEHPDQSTRIFDNQGSVIVGLGVTPPSPLVCNTARLYDSGAPTGEVEVCRSLRTLMWNTFSVSLFSVILGLLIYVTLRSIPLRALRAAMLSLEREKERAEVTLHSIGDAVVTTDRQARIEYLNPVAERLTGWRTDEAAGRPVGEIVKLVNELTNEPLLSPLHQAVSEKRIVPLSNHTALVRRDGQLVAIEDSAAPILNKRGEVIGGVLVFHDVSAARNMAQRLSWQAAHDGLTGLVNRKEFDHLLEEALHSARTQNKDHALCYIDLDQFKVVNDTCGHIAGDELLKQVAALLQSKMRGSDTLARLGGDEFGMLFDSCPLEKALQIATDALHAVSGLRFTWQDKVFTVGASIGIVAVTPHSTSTQWLLGAADTACYSAKEAGRNRIHVFEQGDEELATRREQMTWVSTLTQALEQETFVLYGQVYQALSGDAPQAKHVELLLRLFDKDGAIILPGSFIPGAERYNLMPAIDRWVIMHAFAAHAELAKKFGADAVFAINLSGTSLTDEQLSEFILAQAQAANVPRERFCFELTETAAVNNLPRAISFIRQLRNARFRFALDHFGAGMSSFSYLKNFPVDYLKIDGNLVKESAADSLSRKMVAAINDIGHTMGIRTIAERVDNAEVLKTVRDIGLDFAQGYLVDKPTPVIRQVLGKAEAPSVL